jgi:hypothetical protein
VQGLGVQRDRRRDDQRAHVVQRLPERPRVVRQLRRVAHGVARRQPLHDFVFQRFDDQQIHADRVGALARNGAGLMQNDPRSWLL